ncbi:E3 ubiquitin/ISG15 ligase TRIM25 isoform X1 [Pangasianodon hypophthalmus]|uniref:E3 ubiquitin/ISG15 ligase TRIM25 isoform X1 n=1 Tax=Pangasianodon hypophthalmus TaxID=310915 RepID=UPI0023071267|nr:E3 ubiquitin/ISG15 ligase TRIM25 isoform X1 [Pangasianodon hypophthalmus]
MAEAKICVDEAQFCCSICLDLLKDPVTIPCGHSYCMDCIRHFWDQEAQVRACCCPQCRRGFTVRPELNRNTVLAELVEKLRQTGFSRSSPTAVPGAEGVTCDVCIGGKRPAVTSCLVCLVSYCDVHVQPHYESPAFKKHKLVPACNWLQEKICSVHDRLYEFYCRKEQLCVCYLCTVEEHKTHDTVTAETARAEKADELSRLNKTINQRIQQGEKVSQDLRKAINRTKLSAQAARNEVEKIFADLLASIQRRRLEVMELLRAQEESELREAEQLLEKTELEIMDLKKKNTELQKTLQMDDNIDFLQNCQSLKYPSESCIIVRSTHKITFEQVVQSVSKLQQSLEDICSTEMSNISDTIKEVHIFHGQKARRTETPAPPKLLPSSEPKTREDFLNYACYLTLDSTADHPNLRVSNRAVEWVNCIDQAVSDNGWPQVLCREGLTGRCYWEVEWNGSGICSIGLSQAGESATPRLENGFGRDNLSWGLDCFQLTYMYRHANENIKIVAPKSANRVGIYLDHRAGTLSFYSITNTVHLLHQVHTHFTQPLYPGFALWANGWKSSMHAYLYGRQSLESVTGCMSVKLINL